MDPKAEPMPELFPTYARRPFSVARRRLISGRGPCYARRSYACYQPSSLVFAAAVNRALIVKLLLRPFPVHPPLPRSSPAPAAMAELPLPSSACPDLHHDALLFQAEQIPTVAISILLRFRAPITNLLHPL